MERDIKLKENYFFFIVKKWRNCQKEILVSKSKQICNRWWKWSSINPRFPFIYFLILRNLPLWLLKPKHWLVFFQEWCLYKPATVLKNLVLSKFKIFFISSLAFSCSFRLADMQRFYPSLIFVVVVVVHMQIKFFDDIRFQVSKFPTLSPLSAIRHVCACVCVFAPFLASNLNWFMSCFFVCVGRTEWVQCLSHA